jgi:hypothetical protein
MLHAAIAETTDTTTTSLTRLAVAATVAAAVAAVVPAALAAIAVDALPADDDAFCAAMIIARCSTCCLIILESINRSRTSVSTHVLKAKNDE